MLPLTPSLYVNGSVASTEKVLVDIGTGYFVEVRARPRRHPPARRLPDTGRTCSCCRRSTPAC
jgi:hypothetical protein